MKTWMAKLAELRGRSVFESLLSRIGDVLRKSHLVLLGRDTREDFGGPTWVDFI